MPAYSADNGNNQKNTGPFEKLSHAGLIIIFLHRKVGIRRHQQYNHKTL